MATGDEVSYGDTLSSRPESIFAPAGNTRMTGALDIASSAQHAAILRDLFWTLYSKLAAVLEGHRVVYEVARWISSVSLTITADDGY